jgi:hypothetical protein
VSEMIERVARAIYGDLWDEFKDQEHMKQKMLSASRDAIEAMREPTEDMHIMCGLLGPKTIKEQWQFMIDEALK